jgi:uncharacterized OsmC-like protein/TusA-related sulfurtransferase
MAQSDAGPIPDATCDGGDLDCGSGLLLIIRNAMAPLAAGGILEVKSREASVREDLPAWCRMVGHTLLDVRGLDRGATRFLLRKRGEDTELALDLRRAREHAWTARVRTSGGLASRVAVRNHSFEVGQPASFDTGDAAPSAIEYLLAALAAALASGLSWRLSRAKIQVHDLEVVVKARSNNILCFLGVEDDGHAGLAAIDATLYLDCDADPTLLESAVRETLQRCPITQSLERAVPVRARWRSA